jgi:hypothetical protein
MSRLLSKRRRQADLPLAGLICLPYLFNLALSSRGRDAGVRAVLSAAGASGMPKVGSMDFTCRS